MKKLRLKRGVKKFLGVVGLVVIGGAIIGNSSFYENKKAEVLSDLQQRYIVEDKKDEKTADISVEESTKTDEPVVQEDKFRRGADRTLEEYVWDFFRSQGYTEYQTAGIIGNMYQESRMDPDEVEDATGEGIGLIQWTAERRTNLENYAKSKGKEWKDIDLQLEFFMKEMGDRRYYYDREYINMFNNANSPEEAAVAICWGFERPAKESANIPNRKAKAIESFSRNTGR